MQCRQLLVVGLYVDVGSVLAQEPGCLGRPLACRYMQGHQSGVVGGVDVRASSKQTRELLPNAAALSPAIVASHRFKRTPTPERGDEGTGGDTPPRSGAAPRAASVAANWMRPPGPGAVPPAHSPRHHCRRPPSAPRSRASESRKSAAGRADIMNVEVEP